LIALGTELELVVESLAAGGDGVARSDGLAVFVPWSAPGDRVRARVTESRPRFARAEILELIAPGPGRRAAPCPHFGRCGGCSWLHLEEAEQQRARVAIARAALERIAGRRDLPEIEVIPSPRALGYRARARVAYQHGRIGFRARGSREVVDVERCAVLDPATQDQLTRLRAAPPKGEGELELRGFGRQVALAAGPLEVPADAFFQANGALWERWREVVVESCGSGELAVELYCGVGFYTQSLCARFARVIALEGNAAAARSAARNSRAEIVSEPAERWAPRSLTRLGAQLVLLNPPRAGCHQLVSDALRNAKPRRVVYVSCDCATLARDLERLGSGFRIARIALLDALPQTHHVELVVALDGD
jgi:23S rRNA (uracil1939-C5)-methyltransferase